MKAIVYTTSHCPECHVLKQFLQDYHIPFEQRNCTLQPAYLDEVKKMGFLGVPVTVIGDQKIAGLNPQAIVDAYNKLQT